MKHFQTLARVAVLVALPMIATPSWAAQATGQEEDGPAIFGSIMLSLLHFPVKLMHCVGAQTISAVAYTATFGVPGNYEGGTNGRQIGEVARKSCGGAWLVTPEQVKKDYYP